MSAVVGCEVAREAVSAMADGEVPPVPDAVAAAHLEECSACAQFRRDVVSLARRVRLQPLDARAERPGGADRSAAILAAMGCGNPPTARFSFPWGRVAEWAAAVVPLGIVLPALLLGAGHPHVDPSHLLAPCTRWLTHLHSR